MKIYLAIILTLIAWNYLGEYMDKHVIPFPVCHDGRCGSAHQNW